MVKGVDSVGDFIYTGGMTVGDVLTLKIESVAFRGSGIARHEEWVVFVPETIPGERVTACIESVRSNFATAKVVSIDEPSPDRITPCCRIASTQYRVPGCAYDHIRYDAEVAIKNQQLRDFLERQVLKASCADVLRAPVPSPKDLHYRNKIVLHGVIQNGVKCLGYYGDDNETVVPILECPLVVPEINEGVHIYQSQRNRYRYPCRLTLRWTPHDGICSWFGKTPAKEPPLLEDTVLGAVEVPADGFFQVNTKIADYLVEEVIWHLRAIQPDFVLDLYCGVGIFALAAASLGVSRVVGVECRTHAVASAKRNAKMLLLKASFHCCDATVGAKEALKGVSSRRRCVIVDPPRDGLDEAMRGVLMEHLPETIIYVSCAPDTLARDLTTLMNKNRYSLVSARLFDMFPRTAHFESIVVLQRT